METRIRRSAMQLKPTRKEQRKLRWDYIWRDNGWELFRTCKRSESSPRHIVVNLQKTRNKDKNLEATRE